MEDELSQIAANIHSIIPEHESTPETVHEYDLIISYLQEAPIQDSRDMWKGTKGMGKAMELAIDENMKKEKKSKEEIVQRSFMTSYLCFLMKKQHDSQTDNCGIMQSS